MTKNDAIKQELMRNPRTRAITGVAGFMGSNLLEALLELDTGLHVDPREGLKELAHWYTKRFDPIRVTAVHK